MIVKNYLNYIGSKDRYLSQILDFIKTGATLTGGSGFIDLFCGSAVVGVNAYPYFKDVWCYDACDELMQIHLHVQNATSTEALLQEIDGIIETYGLSKTNKDGYLDLRKEYNEERVDGGTIDPMALYCLITHSYNYSLHLNKKHEYNVPFGANRSSFNSSLRKKLTNWKDNLTKCPRIHFKTVDFRDEYVLKNSLFRRNVKRGVFFIDPPYSASLSKHPYRVGSLRWAEDEDRALLAFLDDLNKKGHLFIFTNVISNNGVTNTVLKKWIEDNNYVKTPVEISYENCSYQRRNGGDTEEVIISNFKKEV